MLWFAGIIFLVNFTNSLESFSLIWSCIRYIWQTVWLTFHWTTMYNKLANLCTVSNVLCTLLPLIRSCPHMNNPAIFGDSLYGWPHVFNLLPRNLIQLICTSKRKPDRNSSVEGRAFQFSWTVVGCSSSSLLLVAQFVHIVSQLTHLKLLNLARDRHREFFDEADVVRYFKVRNLTDTR